MSCVVSALRPALKTGLWIIAITVPVSFGVLLLKMTGLLPVIARLFAPLFALFGMPGESALVFVTAGLVNIYACIAVIETLDLSSPYGDHFSPDVPHFPQSSGGNAPFRKKPAPLFL